ncbi:MAG: hypothetical protein CL609_25330 [Anaerolineaceae bacterium]|nr:hypothetical protein [Anaerolineaceae bacterium]
MPRRWRLANFDLFEGTVKFIEGTIEMNIDFGFGLLRSIHYSIQVKNHSFRITKIQQRLIKSGKNYRIYFTYHGHQFLGAIELETMKNIQVSPPSLVEPLTTRELEVLQLLASGLTNRQIAVQLSLSVNTIKMYTSQVYSKLNVNRRTEAVARARELDIL